MTDIKAKDHGWLEAKQSGGAVYELGVKQSRHGKTIRRIAEICIGYTELPSTCLLDKKENDRY